MAWETGMMGNDIVDKEQALSVLHTNPDSLNLWKAIIAFEGTEFCTSGRGFRPGIKFTYTISRSTGAGGRHYKGAEVEGYGNEMWIIKDGVRSEKSISRSTVDLAFSLMTIYSSITISASKAKQN